jgi:NDP-sugar pyrophosphorylase family protein
MDTGTEALLKRPLLAGPVWRTAMRPPGEEEWWLSRSVIHPTAEVSESIIGPNVSLGAGCRVLHSIIQDSILEDEAQVSGVILEDSLIGRKAQIQRRSGVINAGDNTTVML